MCRPPDIGRRDPELACDQNYRIVSGRSRKRQSRVSRAGANHRTSSPAHRLELASVRALRQAFIFWLGFKHHAHLLGADEGAANIAIFRSGIEVISRLQCWQLVWKPLRIFRARSRNICEHFVHLIFTLSSIIAMPLTSMAAFCLRYFKDVFEALLNPELNEVDAIGETRWRKRDLMSAQSPCRCAPTAGSKTWPVLVPQHFLTLLLP